MDKLPKAVTDYIELWYDGQIKLNKERKQLIEHLSRYVFNRDDIYFDEKKINEIITFTENFYFKLESFQKFIIAFIFLKYKEDDALFYEQFFIMMARGSGKNGFLSALAHYFISELHGIKNYNISIVATSEDQAKTSFEEIRQCIIDNELEGNFDPAKGQITAYDTNSYIKYRTSVSYTHLRAHET